MAVTQRYWHQTLLCVCSTLRASQTPRLEAHRQVPAEDKGGVSLLLLPSSLCCSAGPRDSENVPSHQLDPETSDNTR